MSKAGLPKKSVQFSVVPIGDIPEAKRDIDIPHPPSSPPVRWMRLGWAGLGLAIALMLGALTRLQPASAPNTPLSLSSGWAQIVEESLPPSAPGTLLGHFPYSEVPRNLLVPIVADNSVLMHRAAAERFLQMATAARRDGIILRPLSGFRSVSDQEYIFFDMKAQRGEEATQRAEIAAPPGYSEHHTGYALDIGDGSNASTDVQLSFEQTPTFQWLQRNAAFYSFELSFPKNNSRGISYEPWHWRFVGDRDSLETFYKARTKP